MISKKAQSSEFIGIMVLIIVIVVFAMFGRIGSGTSYMRDSQEAMRNYQLNRFLLVSKVFPYVTIRNVPIDQLLGVYVCYGNQTTDYGLGEIDIPGELAKVLDSSLGEDMWAFQVGGLGQNATCIKTGIIEDGGCRLASSEGYMSHEFIYALPCHPTFQKSILLVEYLG